MGVGGGSAIDPYIVVESLGRAGYQIVTGRTQADPRLASGEKTGIFIVAGQSTAANYVDANYSPTNSHKVQNLNIYNGGVYEMLDPPLGGQNAGLPAVSGSWLGQLGDKLITAGTFARVIFIPIAVGGTQISDWAAGGVLNGRWGVAIKRANAVGLTPSGILWQQGESESAVVGYAQATYQAALASIIMTTRDLGFDGPWFLGKSTLSSAQDATAAAHVRAAIDATIIHSNTDSVWAGADSDTLTGGTNRQADGTHFTAAGADANAGLWKDKIILYPF